MLSVAHSTAGPSEPPGLAVIRATSDSRAMNRAPDWLRQAEDDFLWAKDTLASGRFAQACFVCQQCAEKALKALAFHRGFDRVKSHSTFEIVKALAINGEVEEAAKRLDL